MKSIAKIAEQAASSAAKLIQLAASDISALSIEQKGLHDYVSEVDRGAEKKIVDTIQGAFPDHQILGEEFGYQGEDSSEYRWIIDPLDGTTNFLRSIPHYAVSIGVQKNGEVVHGVVLDVAKSDFFSATKGRGAFLNGTPIKTSARSEITGALLATGVPFSGENLNQIDCFTGTMLGLLARQTSGIRRLGSAALDLAYVAAGRYDGFWEANLKSWDIAAGVLLVEEAGGEVSDLRGGNEYLASGHVLAACSGVYNDMLNVTSANYSP